MDHFLGNYIACDGTSRLEIRQLTYTCHLLGCDGDFAYTVGEAQNGGGRMTIEQRVEQLEKRNKLLTAAVTVLVASICGE
jgi:hypothetical protein